MVKPWRCPHCETNAVIGPDDQFNTNKRLFDDTCWGRISYQVHAILCPNPECRTPTLGVAIRENQVSEFPTVIKQWRLLPESRAISLPNYIPAVLREDYEEACKTVDVSPKASATLARRCLQGMIRDYWGIKKSRLVDEIKALEDKVDPDTWQAIDAVRGLGNIGAHMEKDINLILSVEPEEAAALIELIEDLFQTWYVQRHERQQRRQRVVEIADAKKQVKDEAKSASAEQTTRDDQNSTSAK